jgi:Holliday junction DNA helicase RuvA
VLSALVNLGYQRPSAQKAIEAAVAKDKGVGEHFDALFRAALMTIR